MPIVRYCWRCKIDLPMLTEDEWAVMQPVLIQSLEETARYRRESGSALREALDTLSKGEKRLPALALFEKMTGMNETNLNASWHHRAGMYGPDCTKCGKPLRTPKANWCAYCGTERV